MNKRVIFLISVEKGLEDLFIKEFNIRYLRAGKTAFKEKFNKMNKEIEISLNFETLNTRRLGYVKLTIEPLQGKNDEFQVQNIIISEISSFLSASMICTGYTLVLNEVPAKEILVRDRKGSKTRKFDDFRFKEELYFTLKKIREISNYPFADIFHLSKINILYTKIIEKSVPKKQINDITLKTIDQIFGTMKDSSNSVEGNKSSTNNRFRRRKHELGLFFFEKTISIGISLPKKEFHNIIGYNELSQHPTPLSPYSAGAMLFSVFLDQIKNLKKSDIAGNLKTLIIIDPFTGFGTIPLSAYINIEYLLSLTDMNIERIEIYGYDIDGNAIESCTKNFEKILKKMQKSYTLRKKTPQVHFISSDLKKINPKKILSKSNPNTAITIIITHPPFGLTLKKSDKELSVLYKNFFKIIEKFRTKTPIISSVITGRPDIYKSVSLKDDPDLKLRYIIKKKGHEYCIFEEIFEKKLPD